MNSKKPETPNDNVTNNMNNDVDISDIEKKLASLDIKLKQVKGDEKETSDGLDGKGKALNIAFKIVVELVAGFAVGGFLGWHMDEYFETKPILFIIMLLLGASAGIYNVIKTAKTLQ